MEVSCQNPKSLTHQDLCHTSMFFFQKKHCSRRCLGRLRVSSWQSTHTCLVFLTEPASEVSFNMAKSPRQYRHEGECMIGCVVKGGVISILSVSWGKNISAAVTMTPKFVLASMKEHVTHCRGGREGEGESERNSANIPSVCVCFHATIRMHANTCACECVCACTCVD